MTTDWALDLTNDMSIFDRAEKVINSCTTLKQIEVAEVYVGLSLTANLGWDQPGRFAWLCHFDHLIRLQKNRIVNRGEHEK